MPARRRLCPPRAPRGYTLVELAILLAVVGVLLGGSLLPFFFIDEDNAYRAEGRAMQAQQDAILGYALTHSTKGAPVTVRSQHHQVVRHIPAGRPYLPCPDLDGDGYEDRYDSIQGEYIHPGGFEIGRINTTIKDDLYLEGACKSSRGVLPWKTLGMEAADRWGGRYTYQADALFSGAALGFNQDSMPDAHDPRKGVLKNATGNRSAGNYYYALRELQTKTPAVSGIRDRAFYNQRPFVICDADIPGQECASASEISISNLEPLARRSDLLLKAGEYHTDSATQDATRRHTRRGFVKEGAVYAIISHGKNGHGAVNHQQSANENRLHCNAPVRDTNLPSAPASSVVVVTLDANSPYKEEAVNFPFGMRVSIHAANDGTRRYCPPVEINGIYPMQNAAIVAGIRHGEFGPDGQYFDDIVVWAMRNDIFGHLAEAQRLPAAPLPVFRWE